MTTERRMNPNTLLDELAEVLDDAQFASTCCDKPEDRMWHAADNTWWRRKGNSWISAEPPPFCLQHVKL